VDQVHAGDISRRLSMAHGFTIYPPIAAGALSYLMESAHQRQKRMETPMLKIQYRAPKNSYYAHGMGS
jgi:hypothetical protein